MYNISAFLYEAAASCEEPKQACDNIHHLLQERGLHPPGLLGDLGAGTGLMALLLAQYGWNMYGVELSESMIEVAKSNTAKQPANIQQRMTWTQGDITDFKLPDNLSWEGAICLSNTINHLVERSQVERFIRCAYQALKPNGVLILDSDTRDTFQTFFDHGPVIVWDDGQQRMTRTCRFDAETGRADHTATIERYEPDGSLQLSDKEQMYLQYHPETDLLNIFLAQGFLVEAVQRYNPSPNRYNVDFIPKFLWLLRKPA